MTMHTMQRSLPRQRLTAWIAALAILVAALMPAIAQATSALSGGQAWLEVCTVYGVERIAVDADPDAQGGQNPARMVCPWCHLHVGLPGVAAFASVIPVDYGASRVTTALCEQHVPRTRVSATSSRPRAPPLSV